MTIAKAEKVVVSYSGGKDAALAVFRAIKLGMKPIGAITTFDRKNERSWFHRIPETIVKKLEDSLGIPFEIVRTQGDRYADDFEAALATFKNRGADRVVFGDIDIREHFDWGDERCRNVGLDSFFPLWRENRTKLVEEAVDAGFQAVITIVDTSRLNERFLGKILTRNLVSKLKNEGVDPCGENGEYHTFVYDGPLFQRSVEFKTGEPVRTGKHVYLPLEPGTPDI